MSELIDPLNIREPVIQDKILFLEAMNQSQSLHHPWVSAPKTSEESGYLGFLFCRGLCRLGLYECGLKINFKKSF